MSSLSFNKEKIIEFINQCNSDNLDLSGYEFIDPIYWVILKTLKSGLKPDLTIHVDKDSPTYSYAQYLFGIEDKKAKTTVPIRVIQNRGEVERFVNELLDATKLDFEDWQGSIVTLRFNLDKFQQNIVSYGFTFIRELLVEDNDEGEDIF